MTITTAGFNGGYTVRSPTEGLSTFSLNTGYAYTSGNNIIWDTQGLTDSSVTYSNVTGDFTANATGTYCINLGVQAIGWTAGQSMHTVMNVGLASPLTATYIGPDSPYNASYTNMFFVVDVYMTAGQVFNFSLNVVSPNTINLGNSTASNGTIQFIGGS